MSCEGPVIDYREGSYETVQRVVGGGVISFYFFYFSLIIIILFYFTRQKISIKLVSIGCLGHMQSTYTILNK